MAYSSCVTRKLAIISGVVLLEEPCQLTDRICV